MKGKLVIARGFRDALLVRRVWEAGNGLVYLSSEAEFAKLAAGQDGLSPVGFPAGDVFAYNAAAVNSDKKPNWSQLRRWKAKGAA